MNLGEKNSLKAQDDLILEWMQECSKSRSGSVSTEAREHQDWIPLSPVAKKHTGSHGACSPEPLEDRYALLRAVMKEMAF